nr:hypothetical protein [uncultured Marinobacter sp.]
MNALVPAILAVAMISTTVAAEEVDIDQRNMHIFCASHLTLVNSLANGSDNGDQSLTLLAKLHREEGRKLGATASHFSDVLRYLRNIHSNDKAAWVRLSAQSKRLCLPGD